MNTPLVSVVIPLYNYCNFVGDCIQSIKNQTYKNWEIIIVDDSSDDDSLSIAKSYESYNIRIISFKKNMGYSAAKNEGIINSKGSLLTILDADDMLIKESLEVRVKAIIENNVDFVYANAISVYENISLKQCYNIKKPFVKASSNRNIKKKPSLMYCPSIFGIHAQTVLLYRDLHKIFGLYDESLRSRSDREMWWRFFGQSKKEVPKIKYFFLDKPVVFYRYHKKSMTNYRIKHKKYDKKIRKKAQMVFKIRIEQGINDNNTRLL
ncbi:MAG TPA: glycosyltransferase [Candidatus Paceibacterota bacterium]|nr:glycosyltransferase [Candidatus Paceibacterota bacterium]